MPVSCGIVGLPRAGKTTLFHALSTAKADAAIHRSPLEPNQAIVEVPDERLEVLHRYVETQRVVPAVVRVVDVGGVAHGEGRGGRLLAAIREVDALLHVVQCFDSGASGREGPVDPKKDIEELELELALADLETLTKAGERVGKKARSQDKQSVFERDLFERARALLEAGKSLRHVEWKPPELEALKPLCLLTTKPVLYLANVGDDDLAGAGLHARAVAAHAEQARSQWLALCCDLECELRRMEPADRAVFQAEYGIVELGLDRLIRAVYDLLGLQTFFTVGEKEIRAWTTHRGDHAPKAAGAIHSDFEKLFIRAEVYGVDDLVAHESEPAIKSAGKLRTEGRDYAMREGDVVHFLIGK